MPPLTAIILAGTLGNTWDRALLGYVRDWIVIPLIPNFNLADSMLTCSNRPNSEYTAALMPVGCSSTDPRRFSATPGFTCD